MVLLLFKMRKKEPVGPFVSVMAFVLKLAQVIVLFLNNFYLLLAFSSFTITNDVVIGFIFKLIYSQD